MANFKSLQMQLLDELLWMGGGYVLKFSDRTFAAFFREELELDIDDPNWSVQGGSKGKRMRCFLQTAPRSQVAQALNMLWDYRIVVLVGSSAWSRGFTGIARADRMTRACESGCGKWQPSADASAIADCTCC